MSGNVGIGTWAPAGALIVAAGAGNVGIGSAWPGTALDVNGVIRSTSGGFTFPDGSTQTSAASAGSNYWNYSSSGNIGVSTIQAVGIGTTFVGGAGEGALTVMNGNVGIGTWAPAAAFDLESSSLSGNVVTIDTNNYGNPNNSGTILTVENTNVSGQLSGTLVNFAGGKFSGTDILNVTGGATTSVAELGSSASALIAGNFSHITTAGTNYTQAGNVLNLSRTNTSNGGTLTVSGALASFSDNVAYSSGTFTHIADVLDLTQNYASSTGTVLKAVQAGTGPVATFTGGNVGIGTWMPNSTFVVNGSQAGSYVSISGNTALNSTYYLVLVDATSSAITVTLPTAIGIGGRCYRVKDWKGQSAAHNITVVTSASQTIDGVSSQTLSVGYTEMDFCSDGANWSIF